MKWEPYQTSSSIPTMTSAESAEAMSKPAPPSIERVWWHLHEQITRNHRCRSIEELVKLTMAWLEERGAFKIEGAMYDRLKAAA